MTILVNGMPITMQTSDKSLGQVLTELDEKAERAGQVIIAVEHNEKSVQADELPALSGQPAKAGDKLAVTTQPVRFMRIDAIDIMQGMCDAIKQAGNTQELHSCTSDIDEFIQRYSGLFSAEENSFIENLKQAISGQVIPLPPDFLLNMERTCSFFKERRQEAEDPELAMHNAAKLFMALRDDLSKVAVRLQTGKDAEAMHTMVLIVELINKTVRILPDFISVSDQELNIDGLNVQDFYESFNTVLRELMEAFEHKDSVLIGDLAEYEILPRMGAFFEATLTLNKEEG
ncbi:MAG: hypothetical protein KKI09_09315 [Spirochaetes bacterium]|nr:hypothetical protein [Spirochaetota bacterium]MBU0955612.1 hypothetical protein [Spirochaetota bacterium]